MKWLKQVKWVKHAVVAGTLLMSTPAFAVDLSASATDMSPWGAPGYWGLRVSCPIASKTALINAISILNEFALAMPFGADGMTVAPAQGNASAIPVASDPTQVYVVVIWNDSDLPPSMGGDGQPAWPTGCIANTGTVGPTSAAASAVVAYEVAGMPIGGY